MLVGFKKASAAERKRCGLEDGELWIDKVHRQLDRRERVVSNRGGIQRDRTPAELNACPIRVIPA